MNTRLSKRLRLSVLSISICFSLSAVALESSTQKESSTQEQASTSNKKCKTEHCFKQFKRMRKYARYGNPEAQVIIANAYLTGDGLEQDLERGVKYFNKAMKNGSVSATYILSDLYRQGIGVEKNLERADQLLKKAVGQGYGPALYVTALSVIDFTHTDNHDAVQLLQIAASRNHKPSKYLLAQMVEYGEGAAQDTYEAAKLFSQLAFSRYKDSQQRFDALLAQTETNSTLKTQLAALQSDMEVIEITSKRLSFDTTVDNIFARIKTNNDYQGNSIGHIKGYGCGQSSSACGWMVDEDAKRFLTKRR